MKKTFLTESLVGLFVMLFIAAAVSAAAPEDPNDITGFPTTLYVGDTLTVNASGGTDADNDIITYQYKFYNVDDTSTRQDWSSKNSYKTQNSDAFDKIRVYAKSITADLNSSGNYSEDSSEVKLLMLEINDLDVYVDGKADDVDDGDTIGKEAKPGSTVKFEFVIVNNYDEDDEDELGIDENDMEIEGILITVTIVGIDDDDDLEEGSDKFDLKPGKKSDRESIEFDIPSNVEEDEYNVEIVVEGEDGERNEHRIEWTLTLNVEKEKHDMSLEKAEFDQSTLSCDRETTFSVELVNFGSSDEDELILTIENSALGINIKEQDIEIDEGDDWSKSYTITVKDNVAPGIYKVITKMYYDSSDYKDKDFELNAYGSTDLVISKCVTTSPAEEEEEVIPEEEEEVIVEPVTEEETTLPTGQITREVSFQDTSLYLILLVATVVILGLILLVLFFKLLSK